ncbi:MAG: hypothetical protein HQK55_03045 [Deltaproteobacteria bacterium]|nr:hypothetical protein [Deltaproteobacteria bacterium]
MPPQVVIFSPDKLRGGITKEVLRRAGIETLLISKVAKAKGALVADSPQALVLDTMGCLPEEINILLEHCRTLKQTTVILLGRSSLIEAIAADRGNTIPLSDPLDPELVAEKVKTAMASPPGLNTEEPQDLQADLIEFLRLE